MSKIYKFTSVFLSFIIVLSGVQLVSSFGDFQAAQGLGLFSGFIEVSTVNLIGIAACIIAGGFLVGGCGGGPPPVVPAPVCTVGQHQCINRGPNCVLQDCIGGQWEDFVVGPPNIACSATGINDGTACW